MPLAPCPDCGNRCSLEAYSCPKCGKPFVEDELKNSKKLTSLTQFIADNKDLLTAASVLTALSIFWNNASLKPIGSFLAFLSLVATVPLLFEIYRKANDLTSTWLTVIFTTIFALLVGYTAWYVLVDFRPQWQTEMQKVVMWSLFIPLWIVYRYVNKPKQFKKLDGYLTRKSRVPRLREFIRTEIQDIAKDADKQKLFVFFGHALVFLALLSICSYSAEYIAPVINRRFDRIYEGYKSTNPSPTPSLVATPSPANTVSPTPSSTPEPKGSAIPANPEEGGTSKEKLQ